MGKDSLLHMNKVGLPFIRPTDFFVTSFLYQKMRSISPSFKNSEKWRIIDSLFTLAWF